MNRQGSSKADSAIAQRTLARVLAIKGACDLLFVITLVLIFAFTSVGVKLDGNFEVIEIDNNRSIVGQVSQRGGETGIEIHVFIADQFVGQTSARCGSNETANGKRACEFQIALPELTRGAYEARLYATSVSEGEIKPAMRLLGAPHIFVVEGLAQ